MEKAVSLAVCGATGAGKSSLLKCLTGNGSIKVDDDPSGVTKKISAYTWTHKGVSVPVFDLPGFGDLDVDSAELIKMWNKDISNKQIILLMCINCANRRLDRLSVQMIDLITNIFKDKAGLATGFVIAYTQSDRLSDQQLQSHHQYDNQVKELIYKKFGFMPKSSFVCTVRRPDQLKQRIAKNCLMQKPVLAKFISNDVVDEKKDEIKQKQGRKCFANQSVVICKSGIEKRVCDLIPGDFVLSWQQDSKQFFWDEFLTFIHHSNRSSCEFVRLSFEDGTTLQLTSGHLICSNEKFVMARKLKVGDLVQGRKDPKVVGAIERVLKTGFSAPLTRSGRIVVNDCVASCYAHTTQALGDAATWPLRKFSSPRANDNEQHWYFSFLQQMASVVGLIHE